MSSSLIRCTTLSRWRASSSTTSTRLTFLAPLSSRRWKMSLQLVARGRLDREADGAHVQRDLGEVFARHDVHGDVARARIVLEELQHAQARAVGQADVQQDGAGQVGWWRAPAPRWRWWRPGSDSASRARGCRARRRRSRRPRPPAARGPCSGAAVVRGRRRSRGAARRGRGRAARARARARRCGARRARARGDAAGAAARRVAHERRGRPAMPRRPRLRGTSVHLAGSVSVNVLPLPGALSTEIVPPSRRASSREIDRPRPVPP